ncbi:unnamed protein product [Choristocarpus tenellus]
MYQCLPLVTLLCVFAHREKGEEAVYARKEDQKLLNKLLEKIKKSEDNGRNELMAILGPHKLPNDVIDKIIDWKTHD